MLNTCGPARTGRTQVLLDPEVNILAANAGLSRVCLEGEPACAVCHGFCEAEREQQRGFGGRGRVRASVPAVETVCTQPQRFGRSAPQYAQHGSACVCSVVRVCHSAVVSSHSAKADTGACSVVRGRFGHGASLRSAQSRRALVQGMTGCGGRAGVPAMLQRQARGQVRMERGDLRKRTRGRPGAGAPTSCGGRWRGWTCCMMR